MIKTRLVGVNHNRTDELLSEKNRDTLIRQYGWKPKVLEAAQKTDFKCALCGFDFLESVRSIALWCLTTIRGEDLPCCRVCFNLLGKYQPSSANRSEMIDELREYIEPRLQDKMKEVIEQRKIIRGY